MRTRQKEKKNKARQLNSCGADSRRLNDEWEELEKKKKTGGHERKFLDRKREVTKKELTCRWRWHKKEEELGLVCCSSVPNFGSAIPPHASCHISSVVL